MANLKIVTDSVASLTAEEIKKYNISVVPLSINFGDENFIDGVDITNQEFIDKVSAASGDQMPKSAQPPVGRFDEVYSQTDQPILSIHVGSSFSGTVNAARQAGELQDKQVDVFDTQTVDRAQALMVIAAAVAAEEGQSADEIISMLTKMRDEVKFYVGIDSLKFLIAGGRVSRMTGALGMALNFKVGVSIHDGEIEQIVKGRGQKTIDSFYDDVIEQMQQYKKIDAINLPHSGNPELATSLKEKLSKIYPDVDIKITIASSTITTHGGLRATAIIYHATND